MRVLINDGMDPEGLQVLAEAGITCDLKKRDPEGLLREAAGFDGLVVRSATRVTREVLQAGLANGSGRLKIVGRAGVGVDNVDLAAATECGVPVVNAPHGNTVATGQLALALMLALARKIVIADAALKRGEWIKKRCRGIELNGKTLGVIGCGRIGGYVAERARGFGMNIVGTDPKPDLDKPIRYVPLDELLASSDFITVHVDVPKGRVLLGARELALLKPTAYLINTSRATAIDQKALYGALRDGKIAGAGLDVHPDEPKGKEDVLPFDNPICKLPNVVATCHIGAETKEAQAKTSIEIAEVVRDYLLRGELRNCRNFVPPSPSKEKPVFPLTVFHQNRPGVFNAVSGILYRKAINIIDIPSQLTPDAGRALSEFILDQMPDEATLTEIRALPDVYRVSAATRSDR